MLTRGICGDIGPKEVGDPNSTKIGSRSDLKLHVFGAKGAENFEKMKVFKGKLALFGILRENAAEF